MCLIDRMQVFGSMHFVSLSPKIKLLDTAAQNSLLPALKQVKQEVFIFFFFSSLESTVKTR